MFLVPIGAGCLGEHVGTLVFAGGAAAGEPRRVPRRRSRLLCFCVYDTRAQLTGGPQLSAIEY